MRTVRISEVWLVAAVFCGASAAITVFGGSFDVMLGTWLGAFAVALHATILSDRAP